MTGPTPSRPNSGPGGDPGTGGSPWKAEVNWVLPGATLTQVQDLADSSWWPPDVKRGQLMAVVTDGDRLKAQIAYPRSNRAGPTLQARLSTDDRGVLVQGHLPRTEVTNLTIWVGIWFVIALVVVASARSGLGLLIGLVFVAGFSALTPSLWRTNSRNQRDEVEKLQTALLERFAVDD